MNDVQHHNPPSLTLPFGGIEAIETRGWPAVGMVACLCGMFCLLGASAMIFSAAVLIRAVTAH